jgi:hypothetical protein
MSGLGLEIIREYRWAAATAVFLTRTFGRSLIQAAPSQMAPLHEFCVAQLTHQLEVLGMSDVLKTVLPALEARRATIMNDVEIELDRTFAERRRNAIRNLFMGLTNLASKAFGK